MIQALADLRLLSNLVSNKSLDRKLMIEFNLEIKLIKIHAT